MKINQYDNGYEQSILLLRKEIENDAVLESIEFTYYETHQKISIYVLI